MYKTLMVHFNLILIIFYSGYLYSSYRTICTDRTICTKQNCRRNVEIKKSRNRERSPFLFNRLKALLLDRLSFSAQDDEYDDYEDDDAKILENVSLIFLISRGWPKLAATAAAAAAVDFDFLPSSSFIKHSIVCLL